MNKPTTAKPLPLWALNPIDKKWQLRQRGYPYKAPPNWVEDFSSCNVIGLDQPKKWLYTHGCTAQGGICGSPQYVKWCPEKDTELGVIGIQVARQTSSGNGIVVYITEWDLDYIETWAPAVKKTSKRIRH